MLAGLLALLAGGCDGGSGPATTATRPEPRYSLAATVACLQSRGAVVARVRPVDTRLRALRDLAQRISRVARVGSGTLGFAVARDSGQAQVLAELLAVPDDPYRIAVRGNVVLMYRPSSRRAFAVALSCLRA